MQHANNYWDQKVGPFVDLWDTIGPAHGQNTSCSDSHPCVSPGTNQAYSTGPEEIYEEFLFQNRVLKIINGWTEGDAPLFINYCSHIVHSPLQVPADTFAVFDFIGKKSGDAGDYDKHRQLYTSMVHYLDGVVGKIVGLLQTKKMWNETLWFMQSGKHTQCTNLAGK